MLKVSFIVPLYKPNRSTYRQLSCLNRWPVVVINNSQEPTGDIQKLGKNVVCFTPETNLGYAAGANRGLTFAFDHGAEWGVVINQDLEFSKNTFLELSNTLSNCKPGLAGPFIGSLDPKRWTTKLPGEAHAIHKYVSGSCIAIHRDVYNALHGFYEPFFMYYEDGRAWCKFR